MMIGYSGAARHTSIQRIPQQARLNTYDLYVCLYVRVQERVFGREEGADGRVGLGPAENTNPAKRYFSFACNLI